ncbi:TPA: hypothetical protein ACH3X2_010764 [Trebouxia sp. C0005]
MPKHAANGTSPGIPLAALLTAASVKITSFSALDISAAAMYPSSLVNKARVFLVVQQAFLTLHSIHVSAVGCCAAHISVHDLHVCLVVFVPQALLAQGQVRVQLERHSDSIDFCLICKELTSPRQGEYCSRGDALQGQKLNIPQDQPPSFIHLNISEARNGIVTLSKVTLRILRASLGTVCDILLLLPRPF